MYLIEVTLKANPLALGVQRKEQQAAEALYQNILTALKSGQPTVLELTCERHPEKRIAVNTSEVTAVQVSEKSSSNSNLGLRAGFATSNS
ncbi:hypothetical protein [Candidatus Cyanaurora vandensis]|uniref:hypothetical protein n=1 Tax=Candidatus Cyanaurora vandensis TaxID=2714958 RepID=UPI00257C041A|nr:hypothetical protein [Candidatus Cyanaurora vandensis]